MMFMKDPLTNGRYVMLNVGDRIGAGDQFFSPAEAAKGWQMTGLANTGFAFNQNQYDSGLRYRRPAPEPQIPMPAVKPLKTSEDGKKPAVRDVHVWFSLNKIRASHTKEEGELYAALCRSLARQFGGAV